MAIKTGGSIITGSNVPVRPVIPAVQPTTEKEVVHQPVHR